MSEGWLLRRAGRARRRRERCAARRSEGAHVLMDVRGLRFKRGVRNGNDLKGKSMMKKRRIEVGESKTRVKVEPDLQGPSLGQPSAPADPGIKALLRSPLKALIERKVSAGDPNARRQIDWAQMNLILSEFMSCYLVIGYDMDANQVNHTHAKGDVNADALSTTLNHFVHQQQNNIPGNVPGGIPLSSAHWPSDIAANRCSSAPSLNPQDLGQSSVMDLKAEQRIYLKQVELILSEFLRCFILIGYDLANSPVNCTHAKDQRDTNALSNALSRFSKKSQNNIAKDESDEMWWV